MSESIVEIGIHLFLFVAVVFLVFSFLEQCQTTAEDIRSQAVDDASSTLQDLYLQLSPTTFFSLRLLVAIVFGFTGLLLAGVVGALVLALLGYVLPLLYLRKLRLARVREVETQLVEGLELLKNGLKSGLTIQQASELLVKEFPPPLSQEFTLVLAESRLGVDYVDALQNMANRLGSPIVQILASGVAITKRCGGDLGEIFGNLAETIREQAKIDGKLSAVTAQGRFQGLILGIMPFALLIALYFIDSAHVETLFGHQIGIYALVAVVGMVAVAQLWIRKLMDIDV